MRLIKVILVPKSLVLFGHIGKVLVTYSASKKRERRQIQHKNKGILKIFID
jgi:hypothetical protein